MKVIADLNQTCLYLNKYLIQTVDMAKIVVTFTTHLWGNQKKIFKLVWNNYMFAIIDLVHEILV